MAKELGEDCFVGVEYVSSRHVGWYSSLRVLYDRFIASENQYCSGGESSSIRGETGNRAFRFRVLQRLSCKCVA